MRLLTRNRREAIRGTRLERYGCRHVNLILDAVCFRTLTRCQRDVASCHVVPDWNVDTCVNSAAMVMTATTRTTCKFDNTNSLTSSFQMAVEEKNMMRSNAYSANGSKQITCVVSATTSPPQKELTDNRKGSQGKKPKVS